MKKFLLSLTVALMAVCGAKAEEQVLFEGSAALSWSGTQLSAMNLAASADVTMVITIETTTKEWWQFKFVSASDWTVSMNLGGNEFVNSNNAPEMDWDNPKTYTYEYELDATQIALAKGGLYAQGSINSGELLLKKVVVKDKVKYQNAIQLEYDEWGQVESKAFNGYSDDAKITFTWTSVGAADYIGWGVGALKSLDEKVDTGFGFKIIQEGTNTFSCTLADVKAALNSGPNEYGMYGIVWNIWNHSSKGSECVNTRVSITIAEVEGFTGEGYKAPSSSSIKTIGSELEEASAINLFGQPVNEAKGFMIKGGKKVYVK